MISGSVVLPDHIDDRDVGGDGRIREVRDYVMLASIISVVVSELPSSLHFSQL